MRAKENHNSSFFFVILLLYIVNIAMWSTSI